MALAEASNAAGREAQCSISALAQAEADTFEKRLHQYQELRRDNPHFLAGIWWDQIGKLFTQMKETGRLDLLDNHLGADGLDITVSPQLPKKP